MNIYKSDNGFYNDKPIISIIDDTGLVRRLPSCNNLWIYTALMKAMGGRVDERDVRFFFTLCFENALGSDFILCRRADKYEPPISRDELIGMRYLNVLKAKAMEGQKWTSYRKDKIKKASWFKQIKAMIHLAMPEKIEIKWLWNIIPQFKVIPKHRNYVWENKVHDAYPIAFKLAGNDRYFFKLSDIDYLDPVTIWESIMWHLNYYITRLQKDWGQRNIVWLQCMAMGKYDMASKINIVESIENYFPTDHPIVKQVKEKQNENVRGFVPTRKDGTVI
jgi:hypothetical protein